MALDNYTRSIIIKLCTMFGNEYGLICQQWHICMLISSHNISFSGPWMLVECLLTMTWLWHDLSLKNEK